MPDLSLGRRPAVRSGHAGRRWRLAGHLEQAAIDAAARGIRGGQRSGRGCGLASCRNRRARSSGRGPLSRCTTRRLEPAVSTLRTGRTCSGRHLVHEDLGREAVPLVDRMQIVAARPRRSRLTGAQRLASCASRARRAPVRAASRRTGSSARFLIDVAQELVKLARAPDSGRPRRASRTAPMVAPAFSTSRTWPARLRVELVQATSLVKPSIGCHRMHGIRGRCEHC